MSVWRQLPTAMDSRAPAIVWIDQPLLMRGVSLGKVPHGVQKVLLRLPGSTAAEPGFDQVFEAATPGDDAFDAITTRLDSQFEIQAVVGLTELSVQPAARMRAQLQLPGLAPPAARLSRDKWRMMCRLREHGVAVPATRLLRPGESLRQWADEFPLVVKPRVGTAGCGVIRAEDPTGVAAAGHRCALINRFVLHSVYRNANVAPGVLVQPYIGGAEVAVDGYVSAGTVGIIAIAGKPDVSDGPFFDDRTHVVPAGVDDRVRQALEQVCQQSVAALGIDDSLFHLEARIDGARICVLEVAARSGLIGCVHLASGINECEIGLQLALGNAVSLDRDVPGGRCSAMSILSAHRAGVFRGLNNIEQACSVEHIHSISTLAMPGSRVAPPPEAMNNIAYIFATGPDHGAVCRALRQARARLQIDIR